MTISITSLEKSVRTFAKKLEKQGFTINEIDVFKDGTKGGMYGGSYVELSLSHDDYWEEFKFLANGYASESNWSEMKAKCLESINKEINSVN